MKYPVRLVVNGEERRDQVEARTLLADWLRGNLALFGTQVSCSDATCGRCLVLVDGKAVRSCNYLVLQADGAQVTTIERTGSLGVPEGS